MFSERFPGGPDHIFSLFVDFVTWHLHLSEHNAVIGYPSGQDGAILRARDYSLCPARKIFPKAK